MRRFLVLLENKTDSITILDIVTLFHEEPEDLEPSFKDATLRDLDIKAIMETTGDSK